MPVVESRPQKSDTPYSPESIECMHLCWKMDHGRLGANDIITYSSTIVVVRACGYGFLSGNVDDRSSLEVKKACVRAPAKLQRTRESEANSHDMTGN